jgi:hypothetical protein
VQRLFALMMSLLLAIACGTVATAHAMEPVATFDIREAGILGHSIGDSDEVAADSDKAYPHHHAACHDHVVGLPAATAQTAIEPPASRRLHPIGQEIVTAVEPEAAHRPPRA